MPNKKTREPRKTGYDSDVSDAEWEFCVPYLTLLKEDAPQREYQLRDLFNAVRWMVRTGAPWRMIPNDFAPWHAVYQQAQRWINAGCFGALSRDLRILLRLLDSRASEPSAVVLDSRTLQPTPEAERVQATMAISGAKARRSISRSIRLAISWH